MFKDREVRYTAWGNYPFVDVFGTPIELGDIAMYSSSTSFHLFVITKIGRGRDGKIRGMQIKWPGPKAIKSRSLTSMQQEIMVLTMDQFVNYTTTYKTYDFEKRMLELRNEALARK